MGMLTKKFNSAAMAQTLSAMLQPGEELIAGAYASFQRGIFEIGSRVLIGYVGVTNHQRLIGIKYGIVGETPFSVMLPAVSKLKVKSGIFKTVDFTVKADNISLRFTIARKAGKQFPDQAAYQDLIARTLSQYQR